MECAAHRGTCPLRSIPFFPVIQSKAKFMLVDTMMLFLGSAFDVASKYVPELKTEMADWNDGRRFALGVLPSGPSITLEKQGDLVKFVGRGVHAPQVAFFFKNLDAAVPVFVGLNSTHHGFAQGKIMIQGNLAYAMEVNRAMTLVLAYLFPVIAFKHLFKAPPKLGLLGLINKAKVYMTLVPQAVVNLYAVLKKQ